MHYAAVTGDLDFINHREFRQQVYLSKDQNGLSAFHKAVANGNKQIADHLLEKTDRGIINQVNKPNGNFAVVLILIFHYVYRTTPKLLHITNC